MCPGETSLRGSPASPGDVLALTPALSGLLPPTFCLSSARSSPPRTSEKVQAAGNLLCPLLSPPGQRPQSSSRNPRYQLQDSAMGLHPPPPTLTPSLDSS